MVPVSSNSFVAACQAVLVFQPFALSVSAVVIVALPRASNLLPFPVSCRAADHHHHHHRDCHDETGVGEIGLHPVH